MTRDLISVQTRNEFREFLSSGWVLKDIQAAFEAAHIKCDRSFQPEVSGQRRSFVEQHYRTLDFTKPVDARKVVLFYENVLKRAQRRLADAIDRGATERAIEDLKACLLNDGLAYHDGKITPAGPQSQPIFDDEASGRSITEFTRRAIFDEIRALDVSWSGRLSDTEFLKRLFDLSVLPSHDARHRTMLVDVQWHRELNRDWNDDWVFSDSRLNLLGTSDEILLRVLCEMLHPVVRPERGETGRLAELLNGHLASDGWELVATGSISGRPTFSSRRLSGTLVALGIDEDVDILTGGYVRELSCKCDDRLSSGDFEGAVTVGRTLLEAVLNELEVRLTGAKGDYKGDLPKQFKQATKLLHMDDKRTDLDDRFKDVIRGLVMVANGLAPLRNRMSDGHARERKPAPHHARVVVNAAKTVAAFLVESYIYQRDKGALSEHSSGEGA